MLGVPCLAPPWAIAEKLLANADRGRAREYRARDVIDLAFVSLGAEDGAFVLGYELAEPAYGRVVFRELDEVLKMLDLDPKYRAQCVSDLLITDVKVLRKGLERLRRIKRVLRKSSGRATKA